MEIRGIRESEIEEMINLQCLTFRPDGHQRYRQYVREDPTYRHDQSRVVVINGRIIATLRIWERRMRIGTCIVRMGGIGSVCTHPHYRNTGYATALMNDTVDHMRTVGYDLSVLFSIIPTRFYRRLGWACFPLEGFRIKRGQHAELTETTWKVEPFDEGRDLDSVAMTYEEYNAQQSGSIVRNRSYWDMAPSRIRDGLPTVVARRDGEFGGYLNFQISDKNAHILEVAHTPSDSTALVALAHHLLQVCEQEGVEDIHGEIPHRHPLVDVLIEGSGGDLHLTGHELMMVYAVNLSVLLRQLLPDLQSRFNSSNQTFEPISIGFEINNQSCVLRLHQSGDLQVFNSDPNSIPLKLPARFFWRLIFGESSWRQLEPTLSVRGIPATPEASALLSILFPQQDVIFWTPDHY